jgi:hypothetical protein
MPKLITRATLAACLILLAGVISTADATRGGQAHLLDTAFEEVPARAAEGEVKLISDPECNLASELEGTWVMDVELAKQLCPKILKDVRGKDELDPLREFTVRLEDEKSAGLTKLREWLKKVGEDKVVREWLPEFKEACRRVYAAGEVQEGEYKTHFVLVEWRGNMNMVTMRKSGGVDVLYVAMACDKEADNDYLFMREDRSETQPYKRKAAK